MWQKFIGIVKYSIKGNETREIQKLLDEIGISELALKYALDSLKKIGISYENIENNIIFKQIYSTFSPHIYKQIRQQFQDIIKQENLQKTYFYQVSISTIKEEIV